MGGAKHDGLAVPGKVVLAHEPAFRIGDLHVDPPSRQVERGDVRESLEPRVMQVLVALFRAGSRIVPRDDLVAQCWDGRVIGDDAINRVISRIRQVAAGIGGGTFAVETIARVGHRLVTTGTDAGRLAPLVQPERRKLMIGAATALIVAAFGGGAAWRATLAKRGRPDEARLLFDRAEAIRSTGLVQDNRQAMAYLREAVRIAPDYGQAWGALALTYRSALAIESAERAEGFEEMRQEAIRHAEILDPGSADAAAARMLVNYYGRWGEVEKSYRETVRLHPAHPAPRDQLGSLLMDVGRWDDAAEALAKAKALNNFSPILPYKLAVALWSAGRITEAEAEIDKALKRWPQHSAIWQTKVKLLALTGRPRMALALAGDAADRPIEERPESVEVRRQFHVALVSGLRDDQVRAAQVMVAAVRSGTERAETVAPNCAALGFGELALDLLEGLYLGEGEWSGRRVIAGSPHVVTHPLFQPHSKPLWASPRFERLLERIGLEHYWASSNRAPDFRRIA